jgi:predicted amidohydrolase
VLRVTVLELPARWGDAAAALVALERLLERGPETDLVVLPELALTGYVSAALSFDVTPFAEPTSGPTMRGAAEIAARRRVHLLLPHALREGKQVYNACSVIAPDGARLATYRKRHPWAPETWATRGPDPPPVIDIGGVRTTIAICYDVHFLAWDTHAELEASDLLLFPSAWVDPHDTRLDTLVSLARRFEVSIASANWSAGVVNVRGQGDSCIIGRRGEILARVTPGDVRADAEIT